MREILANVKPAGPPPVPSASDQEHHPGSVRLSLTKNDIR
jgi:hypothetical protein